MSAESPFFKAKPRNRLAVVTAGAVAVALAAAAAVFVLKRPSAPPVQLSAPSLADGAVGMGEGRAQAIPISARVPGRPNAGAGARGYTETFDEACLRPIRLKRFADAIEGCNRFTTVREKAGHAHSALAAIYATRSYINIPASVHHAQMAADFGDGRGKFMVVFHSLSGQSPQRFDLERALTMLKEARVAGVNKAQQYIDIIEESKRCRAQAIFKLLEQPVFCYFRPEVSQLLTAKGMTERQKDLEEWVDTYRPGEILESADRADAIYDRDPREELHRLARFTYTFNAKEGIDREALLRRVLTDKYGKPEPMESVKQVGGRSEWRLTDGVAIALSKDADGNVQVHYTLPKRWEDRTAHIKRERELEQNAQLMREQVAL